MSMSARVTALIHRGYVEGMLADPPNAESQGAAYWLAQIAGDYERLVQSVATLGTQLSALGARIDVTGLADLSALQPQPLTVSLAGLDQAPPTDVQKLIHVNLLGPFQIYLAGGRVQRDIPGQVQTVLKYLVSQQRRPVSRDTLMDLLWPDADPAVSSRRLRVLMHTLRRCLPCDHLGFSDLVVLSGNNFLLNPQARVWVDVEEFERHWHSGWRLSRAGHARQAVHEYEHAEALYTGDYLQDEQYADWTLLRREALRDAYATILTMLATISFEARDYTGAIIWSQKLLAQDECREDAYRILISSHSALGQQSRAAYWCELCSRTLKRELAIDLSPETQQLYDAISGR